MSVLLVCGVCKNFRFALPKLTFAESIQTVKESQAAFPPRHFSSESNSNAQHVYQLLLKCESFPGESFKFN